MRKPLSLQRNLWFDPSQTPMREIFKAEELECKGKYAEALQHYEESLSLGGSKPYAQGKIQLLSKLIRGECTSVVTSNYLGNSYELVSANGIPPTDFDSAASATLSRQMTGGGAITPLMRKATEDLLRDLQAPSTNIASQETSLIPPTATNIPPRIPEKDPATDK